jgi:hypothetical protein
MNELLIITKPYVEGYPPANLFLVLAKIFNLLTIYIQNNMHIVYVCITHMPYI